MREVEVGPARGAYFFFVAFFLVAFFFVAFGEAVLRATFFAALAAIESVDSKVCLVVR